MCPKGITPFASLFASNFKMSGMDLGGQMNKSGYESKDGPQDGGSHRHSGGSAQYVLQAERQILQLISARAPVAKILNEICYALDCQIGNMVSVVSLSEVDCIETAEIAENAALFGLHVFFSTGIATDSGENLGTLEMYSIVSRKPTARELPLIARALCLAAIAIACRVKGRAEQTCRDREHLFLRGFVAKQPTSLN